MDAVRLTASRKPARPRAARKTPKLCMTIWAVMA